MKTLKQAYGVSFAVTALAAAVSMDAHAGYRCAAPPMPQDKRACELARVDRPDELRLFIQRTSPIHGLYFYDYVTEVDVNRWYVAQRREEARLSMKADDRDKEKISSR
jgi:hypothetical protein